MASNSLAELLGMRFVTASRAKQPRGSRMLPEADAAALGCFAPLAMTGGANESNEMPDAPAA